MEPAETSALMSRKRGSGFESGNMQGLGKVKGDGLSHAEFVKALGLERQQPQSRRRSPSGFVISTDVCKRSFPLLIVSMCLKIHEETNVTETNTDEVTATEMAETEAYMAVLKEFEKCVAAGSATWYDYPLPDGTRLGNATGAELQASADQLLRVGKAQLAAAQSLAVKAKKRK